MSEPDFALLVDLHRRNARLGPGSAAETRRALELARLDRMMPLRVADVGCGTGASALELAEVLGGPIAALDLFPEFLDALSDRAALQGIADRIETIEGSFDALPLAAESLDLLWSEGAIYLVGFAEGLDAWRTFLKPGGVLAVTEISWTTEDRPAEIDAHWNREYPGIATVGTKIRQIEAAGYEPLGHFEISPACWEAYYGPLRAGFDAFLERHGGSDAARAIVEAEAQEMWLHERYGSFFNYVFYIARRSEDA